MPVSPVSPKYLSLPDSPLISIIVPVYKVEPYLRRCLDSVIQQTYRNLEIILIDDGFPDNCGAICDDYASRDSRIRVIHQANGGASVARNAGLDVAKGEYIGFVDSDDYIAGDMFDRLKNAIVTNKADMVVCNYLEIRKNGLVPHPFLPIDAELDTEAIRERLLDDQYPSFFCNKLFSQSLFDGVRFPQRKIYEDFLLMTRMCCNANRITGIEESLYYYNCLNHASITYDREDASSLAQEYSFFLAIIDRMEMIRSNRNKKLSARLPERATKLAWSLLRKNAVYSVLTNEQIEVISRFLKENKTHIKKKMLWFLFKNFRPVFNVYARYRTEKIRKRKMVSET